MGYAFGTIMGFLGLLKLISGVGLLVVVDWARWLVLIGAGLHALASLVGLVTFNNFGMSSFIIDGMVIWYFLRPGVKAQFAKQVVNHKA